jgi:hypothetical protein
MDLVIMRHILISVSISSVLLFLGYNLDIKPLLTDLDVQEQIEKQSQEKIQENSRTTPPKPVTRHITRAEKNTSLMAVMKSTEQQGLLIQSAEVHSDARQHFVTIHIMALGQLTPALNFFASLNTFQFPVLLNNFSLEVVNQSDIQLNAHLDLYTMDKKKQAPATLDVSTLNKVFSQVDSTQDMEITDVIKKPTSTLSSTPLKNLRFIGLVTHGHHRWSVLRLPNDEMAEVQIGDKIGMEQSKIISMNENGIIVDKNNQRCYIALVM